MIVSSGFDGTCARALARTRGDDGYDEYDGYDGKDMGIMSKRGCKNRCTRRPRSNLPQSRRRRSVAPRARRVARPDASLSADDAACDLQKARPGAPAIQHAVVASSEVPCLSRDRERQRQVRAVQRTATHAP
jgi:hypothetical protein